MDHIQLDKALAQQIAQYAADYPGDIRIVDTDRFYLDQTGQEDSPDLAT